jgi:tRNA-2-methylthio-N6-dimethylallyladenosine synthase
MNVHDSRKIEELLGARGYRLVDDPRHADLVILNTCTVRDKAEQKVLSEVGRLGVLKRRRPEMKIGIAGCVAQRQGARLLKRLPAVDLVIGPDNLGGIGELVVQVESGARVARTELYDEADYPFIGATRSFPVAGVSAYVTVQKGCDKRCTFCIVPAVRGGEVSRDPDDVVAECVTLAGRGVREVTLLGQTINSYGKRLERPCSFADVLRRVAAVPGLARVRFTTSYPPDLTDDIVACLREVPQVMEFLHLPVQSGSDAVLRRMGRRYSAGEYADRIACARATVPEVGLATDIIVGFPGETDADFEATLRLLEVLRFDTVFSFLYSPRPGTPAVKLLMRDDVPAVVKQARLMRLKDMQQTIGHAKNQAFVGREVEVLVEGPSPGNPERLTGRSRCNRPVHFPHTFDGGPRHVQVGDVVRVAVRAAGPYSLVGRALERV